jgi:hypothetical protein
MVEGKARKGRGVRETLAMPRFQRLLCNRYLPGGLPLIYQVQLENWSFSLGKTPLLDLDKVYMSSFCSKCSVSIPPTPFKKDVCKQEPRGRGEPEAIQSP